MFPFFSSGCYSYPPFFNPYITNQNFPYSFTNNFYVPNFTPASTPLIDLRSANHNANESSIQRKQQIMATVTEETQRTRNLYHQVQKQEPRTTRRAQKKPPKLQIQIKKIDKQMPACSSRIQTRSQKRNLRIIKDKNKFNFKKSNKKTLSEVRKNKNGVKYIKQKQVTESTLQIKNSGISEYSDQSEQLQEYQPSSLKPAIIPFFIADMEQIKQMIYKKKQSLFSRMIKN